MNKKIFSLVILGISTTLLLSACGQSVNNENAGNTANTSNIGNNTVIETKVQDRGEEIIEATDLSMNPEKALNRKDTFIAGISAPGGVFLPYFYDNGWDGNASGPMFASLIDFDKEGKPAAMLAESWDISDDQLTYTFHLREGLKFSNGSPITAEDVAFTLTLLHDPSYNGYTDISLASIKGGEEYSKGDATSISGIKVIDPQTIEITTEKVNAQTLMLLGGQVLSKEYYGKDYKKGDLEYLKALYPQPMGAGPYKFEKYIPGQEIRYIANENYYAGKPEIEHFIYKVTSKDTNLQLLQTGEIDYDGFAADADNIEILKSLGFANIRVATANSFGFAYINNNKPHLKDKLVRQALLYGLDRQKYVDAKYKGYGEVANVPASPLLWSYTEDGINKYEFNQEKAKELLDQAGWIVGEDGIREKDGEKLRVSYLTRDKDDVFIPIAQENYKDIGIELYPEIMDFNALVAKLKAGNYDLAAVSTSMLTDPHDAVGEFVTGYQGNFAAYSNPKVDELIKEGVSTTDIEKRKEIYKKLYKELTDDPAIMLLSYRKSVAAYNGRLQGFEISNYSGILYSLPNLKIKE